MNRKLASSSKATADRLVPELDLPAPPPRWRRRLQRWQTAMVERQAARTQREIGVRTRSVEAQALLDLLQLVAAYHVVFSFGGAVDPRLQEMGFQVIGPE